MNTTSAIEATSRFEGARLRGRWLRTAAGFGVMSVVLAALVLGALRAHGAGWALISVHGGSMGDTIPTGSLVIAKREAPESVAVADVILVREQTADGSVRAPKLHRVVEVESREGQVFVRTKGDRNGEADPEQYLLQGGTLVERWHVPRVGYWVSFLGTPLGWLTSVALPFTVVAAAAMASIWRRRRAEA